MNKETIRCTCGGTMIHSDDMENPFAGNVTNRDDLCSFYQCQECGNIVDTAPAQHTLLPWRVHISKNCRTPGHVEIIGFGSNILATVHVKGNCVIEQDGVANAAFIVQAVNSYDRLREVNKALREVWRAAHNFIGAAAKYKAAAEAVLAEAVHEADKVNP